MPEEVNRLRQLLCVRFDQTDTTLLPPLDSAYSHLHAGERAALQPLAVLESDTMPVDDFDARIATVDMGYKVVGLLGMFRQLKEDGYVETVKPYVDRARAAGFRVSRRFYAAFLPAVGE